MGTLPTADNQPRRPYPRVSGADTVTGTIPTPVLPTAPAPAPRRRGRTILAWTLGVLVVIVGGVLGYGAYVATSLDSAVGRFHLADDNDKAAAAAANGKPFTVLLLGSDTREGGDSTYIDKTAPRKGQGGNTSDVMLLVRIDPAKAGAEMLSVHRDLHVEIPGHGIQKINAAYTYGGPQLAKQMVEAQTGIGVNHVAVVDFAGARDIVDAVGGVDLCLDTAQKDHWTGLNLPEGCTHVNGTQAVAYTRSRHTLLKKNGHWVDDLTDDYGRMHRHQTLLRALAARAAQPDILTRLPALADAIHGKISVDDRLDMTEMIAVARRLAGHLDQVTSAALPVYNHTINGVDYVELNRDAATPVIEQFTKGTMPDMAIKEQPPGGKEVPASAAHPGGAKK